QEGLADRVKQVRLAAAGAAMNEQRIEGDGFGGGQGLGRGCRNLVGLADDKSLKTVALIEVGGRWIALCGGRRRGRDVLQHQERRRLWTVGTGDNAHISDNRQYR